MKRSFLTKYFHFAAVLAILAAGCSSQKEDEGKIPLTASSEEAKEEFLKGRDLFEKLKGTESLQFLESAIKKDGNFALAHYYHSLSNATAKGFFEDMDKAVSLAEKASEGEKLLILSFQEGVNGNTKKQEEYLKKLVELYPKDERAHFQFGTFYFGLQDYQKASDHLKKSIELDSAFAPAYNLLGYSERNLGRYSDAEVSFKKYIELIPNDPNPYDSYAELLLKMGKYNESIQQYEKALSVDNNFVPSYVGIAANYNYLGKYEDARRILQSYYEMARNEGEKRGALFSMAVSYLDEGNYQKALEEMDKQLKMGEKINDAAAINGDLITIGNILVEKGRYDEAMENYKRALEVMESSDLSAELKNTSKRLHLYNEGKIALIKGDIKTAKEKSDQFREEANASNNTFQVWLSHELQGLIALKEKDFNKAEEEFKQANQQNPYTFYRLAMASEGNKDKEGARKYYEMAANFNSLNNMNQSFIRSKALKLSASK